MNSRLCKPEPAAARRRRKSCWGMGKPMNGRSKARLTLQAPVRPMNDSPWPAHPSGDVEQARGRRAAQLLQHWHHPGAGVTHRLS